MGTASVAVAGIFAALRVSEKPLKDNLFLFQGAGSANLGIARLLKAALGEFFALIQRSFASLSVRWSVRK